MIERNKWKTDKSERKKETKKKKKVNGTSNSPGNLNFHKVLRRDSKSFKRYKSPSRDFVARARRFATHFGSLRSPILREGDLVKSTGNLTDCRKLANSEPPFFFVWTTNYKFQFKNLMSKITGSPLLFPKIGLLAAQNCRHSPELIE